MALLEGGKVKYRLRFLTRPDLDSDDFVSDQVYEADMEFRSEELPGEWRVKDVLYAPEGEPDTLSVAPEGR